MNPGLPDDIEMAKKSKNIDMIIGGHSHTLIDESSEKGPKHEIENANGEDVLICQVGKSGKYLGYVEIDLDDDEFDADSKFIPITAEYDNRIDKNLEAWIAPYKFKVDSLMNNTVAFSAKEMDKDNAIY